MTKRSDQDLRLRLELTGIAESVATVRSALRTVAGAAALDRRLADDMRTAISEACNNVVLHAYAGTPGPLIFSVAVQGDLVDATVRDHGCGIRPGLGSRSGLGMGITLMNALAERVEVESSGIGTEVRMRFRRPAPSGGPPAGLKPEVWAPMDPGSSGGLRAPSG
jgi:anti-sigma regulatory factor (Ser/Thr protein kinase)